MKNYLATKLDSSNGALSALTTFNMINCNGTSILIFLLKIELYNLGILSY